MQDSTSNQPRPGPIIHSITDARQLSALVQTNQGSGGNHSYSENIRDFPLSTGSSSSSKANAPSDAPKSLLHDTFLALELCGGSAMLTKCFCLHGLSAISIDWKRNASSPVGPSIQLDLTKEESHLILRKAAQSGRLKYVHAGPPCGTAARSREIPVPQWKKDLGAPEPKPLRSDTHPHGIPGLSGIDRTKVELANMIYKFVAKFMHFIHDLGILWSVENPRRSIMWLTSWFQVLARLPGVFVTNFDNCMHGGSRPKRTSLLHNVQALCELEGQCAGETAEHVHRPWASTSTLTSSGRFQLPRRLHTRKNFVLTLPAVSYES